MGNDMRTYGASLRLAGDIDESDLVALARTVLTDPAAELHKFIDRDALTGVTTLEELFGVFRLLVCRRRELVVSCFGADGRYNQPQDLYAAIAPGVADGSWVAFSADYNGTYLVTFTGGVAHVSDPRFDETLFEWDWARQPDGTPTLTGDRDADLTAQVAHMSGRADLTPGVAAPRYNTPEHNRLETCLGDHQPWLLY